MTTPHERARALIWAGGFLIEIARDETLPVTVRQRAVAIARHFPTDSEVLLAAASSESGVALGLELARPKDGDDWEASCPHGPLSYSTKLDWPQS